MENEAVRRRLESRRSVPAPYVTAGGVRMHYHAGYYVPEPEFTHNTITTLEFTTLIRKMMRETDQRTRKPRKTRSI